MKRLRKKIRQLLIGFLLQNRTKSGYYAIDMNTGAMGLGARIINMLEILLYCDTKGYIPLIKFNYKEKNNTTDYFKELFFYKNEQAIHHPEIKYTSIHDTSDLVWKNYNKRLRLNMANVLFEKYLGFNQQIIDEVNTFTNQRFTGKQVLGIHYRGTDKTTEAPEVTYEELLNQAHKILSGNPALNLIFLSSDDAQIIHYLVNSDLTLPVIYREDVIRSETRDQIHLQQNNSKTVINRDAMVNCLILSRCNHLLKTASLLSDCSVIFNPGLHVSVINAPYSHATWWPTSEINTYALINKNG